MLRFETAGESHGECLVATLTESRSSGRAHLDREDIDRDLWRRQQGLARRGGG